MKTLYGDFYMGMKTRLGCCSALHSQFPVPFSISSKDREIKTQNWIRTPEFQFSFSFDVVIAVMYMLISVCVSCLVFWLGFFISWVFQLYSEKERERECGIT